MSAVVCVAMWYAWPTQDLELTGAADTASLQDDSTLVWEQDSGPRPHKLADGCTHVYLDVGSNVGVQVRKAFEPHLYPESPILPLFNDMFGPSPERNHKLCAFGFEANPAHVPRLTALESCYRSKGWRTTFFAPLAVADKNGTMLLQYEADRTNEFWGASIVPQAKGPHGLTQGTDVQTIDFAEFLLTHIAGRTIPAVDVAAGVVPTVFMKLDIEGAEYFVLPRLVTSGALCHVASIFMEWHPRVATDAALAGVRDAQAWLGGGSFSGAPRCRRRPKLSAVDDESYLHDGQPAPAGCSPIPGTT
jgi:hypothetical protein